VPNWDRSNNIYHGDSNRGNVGGLNCTFCHTPGTTDTSKIHFINSTQDSGKNFVPDCQDSRCHGNSTTQPTGEGTWIPYSHGESELAEQGLRLECVDCHNNQSVRMINTTNYTVTLNTYLHTGNTSAFNITPFNATRLDPATGEVSATLCLNCHGNTTGVPATPNCGNSGCHLNNSGAGTLLIHDDDMGVEARVDGRMRGGGPNCADSECHDVEGDASALVNVSIMNDTNSVHRLLNNRTGDPGVAEAVDNWNSRRCWACHSNGSFTGAEGPETMGLNRTTPWLCPDCHLPTGSQFNKYFIDVGEPTKSIRSRSIVYQHYVNASNLKASSNVVVPGTPAANNSDPIAGSCINCHNRSEQLIPNNDADSGTPSKWQNYVGDGDGNIGGPISYYHYGKKRGDLRRTRNSGDCGDGVDSDCTNLNNFTASTDYNYTDCSWCHQNTSTAFIAAFNFSSATDPGVQNIHDDMLNHSNKTNSPYCTDCHIVYNLTGAENLTFRLHDPELVKPSKNYTSGGAGMYNSAGVCEQCHTDKDVHSQSGPSLSGNAIECADCHANASAYTVGYGNKQIHGIRYVNQSGVYSEPWNNGSVADCTTCHMGVLVSDINNSIPPKVPTPTGEFNHSNNASAGSLWNDTVGGYLGPWKPASNNLNACWYCHGNVTEVQHNATGLGRINIAFLNDIDNEVNGSIDTTSYYCSECHYPGNTNRTAMIQQYLDAGLEAPQNNTQNQTDDPSYFFNHSSTLATSYSDNVCRGCHGSLLSGSAKMDEFAHNVAIGSGGGPECLSCHGVGLGPQINQTSFLNSSHATLNNFTANINGPCWACHSNGSATGAAAGPNEMGLNQTTPWRCPDCHAPNQANSGKYPAPVVTAHMPDNVTSTGSNLTTNASNAFCTDCHKNSIGDTNVTGAPGFSGRSLLANVSHYLTNTSLRIEGNTTFTNATSGQSANCTFCHYDDSARATWGQAPDPRLTKKHEPQWTPVECGSCHFQSLAGTLHDPKLTGSPVGGPGCTTCHDVGGISPAAPKVNVSAMNQSGALHRNLNNRTGTPGASDTNTTLNWNNRRCWACHAAGNSTDSFGVGSGNHPANYEFPFNCTNCHVNGSAGNDVYFVSSTPVLRNLTNHWDGNATNESRGQAAFQKIFVPQPFAFNDSECIECHNNSLGTVFDPDANDTAASNVSHYGINASGTPVVGPGLVQNSAQNCTYCHVQSDESIQALWLTNTTDKGVPLGNIRHETNVSHCDNCHGNLSSSVVLHSDQLTKAVSVHYAFDWEGDDAFDDGDDIPFDEGPFPNKQESCIACHEDMFSLKFKICEDCHLPNGTGPFPNNTGFTFDLRSDLAGWNVSDRQALGIPIIYSHVPVNQIQNATTGLEVSRNLSGETGEAGFRTRSSCFSWNPNDGNGTCHGVSFSSRFKATPPEDVAAGKQYFMHYGELEYGDNFDPGAPPADSDDYFNVTYMNTYIQDFAPNTTDCLWCHNRTENASVRRFWGNAILIYNNRSNQSQFIGPELMFGATENRNCTTCHTSDQQTPNTFHVNTLRPTVSANCLECHDQANPADGVSHDINVSVFNTSVHKNSNNVTDISNGTWPVLVKACWGCHNENGEEGGMQSPRYNNPYTCPDCHIDTDGDGIGDGAYQNVSAAPKVLEHFTNGTEIRASYNTTIVRSCKNCHNNEEMINANDDTETSTFDADGDGLFGTDQNFYHYGKNSSTLQNQYDITRNSSDCGDGSTLNCSKLNNFPRDINITFTNCSYCHQNPTSSNNFTKAMNLSTGAGEHDNMLNHTDKANGPFCTDCHILYDGNTTVRIHDAPLRKPSRNYTATDGTGMYDSANVCEQCHTDKEVHADDSNINTDSLECASCHANASVYIAAGETVFGDKQIHGIRFINDSGIYSAQWDRTSAANCTTCHMGFVSPAQINASPTAGVIPIPQIPLPGGEFNHSDNDDAGLLWNTTQDGFNGPWKPSNNNLRACLYCHGNVNRTNTSVNNITNIIHNATALGRANAAFEGTGNIVNGSISTSSFWCSNCHTPTLNKN
jgi:nitrate reductase cytochrome c-type subunit